MNILAQNGIGIRVPPQNIEAEQAVLGSILLKDKAFTTVLEIIEGNDFYKSAHRIIFEALVDLFEKNEPQDLLTLSNLLNDQNKLEEIGGIAYLTSLTSIVPVTANIASYAKIIRQKSILRQLIQVNSDIASRCYEEQGDIDTLVDEAEQAIFDIAGAKSNQHFIAVKHIVPKAFETVENLFKRKELITGVPTGYYDIDRITAGLQPSDLIILAARPSMGKTAFAMNIAQHAAMIEKIGVAIFSLEMSKEQLVMRLLSSVGKIDSQRIRTGRLQNDDWPKLTRAVGMLSEAPIYIDDTPAVSVLEMRAKVRRLAAQFDIGLVVVDYLQLMQGRSNSENRTQEISDISRSLKALAKEHHIPVLALSQLNRGLESRTDKRPMMADLRESGAIEQDADVICFIYRDEVYNKGEDNPNKGSAEVIIGKQRNGPTGMVKLTFLKEFTMFENMSAKSEYETI
ncbi:replicative DNA helicase [Desulfoprunum benzoelyticum]|uniref:Replicative DNA helicase n=1 Tax=Desulfoprunum benzoelyticum TaxID=1506996 RepID=A0A840UY47_9BACT|nr:replicative DNA helicase [Desulfoprunum benzoelyticum]MBB5346420.1 replicative DNA helicase [Desulfoprunum benzoelyticum]MBM9528581.1 replicative DNA helicase [Desulfoprunum benzoelyticum]